MYEYLVEVEEKRLYVFADKIEDVETQFPGAFVCLLG